MLPGLTPKAADLVGGGWREAAAEVFVQEQVHTVALDKERVVVSALLYSIGHNNIGAEGASTLAAILKETQIQELECAAAFERSLFCQCPLTLTACLSPWKCRRARASDRRAHGHKADPED